MFEKFRRSDLSQEGTHPGWGLGLTLVQAVVDHRENPRAQFGGGRHDLRPGTPSMCGLDFLICHFRPYERGAASPEGGDTILDLDGSGHDDEDVILFSTFRGQDRGPGEAVI